MLKLTPELDVSGNFQPSKDKYGRREVLIIPGSAMATYYRQGMLYAIIGGNRLSVPSSTQHPLARLDSCSKPPCQTSDKRLVRHNSHK